MMKRELLMNRNTLESIAVPLPRSVPNGLAERPNYSVAGVGVPGSTQMPRLMLSTSAGAERLNELDTLNGLVIFQVAVVPLTAPLLYRVSANAGTAIDSRST